MVSCFLSLTNMNSCKRSCSLQAVPVVPVWGLDSEQWPQISSHSSFFSSSHRGFHMHEELPMYLPLSIQEPKGIYCFNYWCTCRVFTGHEGYLWKEGKQEGGSRKEEACEWSDKKRAAGLGCLKACLSSFSFIPTHITQRDIIRCLKSRRISYKCILKERERKGWRSLVVSWRLYIVCGFCAFQLVPPSNHRW